MLCGAGGRLIAPGYARAAMSSMKSSSHRDIGCAFSVAAVQFRRMPRRLDGQRHDRSVAIACCADHRGSTATPRPAWAISIMASVSMMNDRRAGEDRGTQDPLSERSLFRRTGVEKQMLGREFARRDPRPAREPMIAGDKGNHLIGKQSPQS